MGIEMGVRIFGFDREWRLWWVVMQGFGSLLRERKMKSSEIDGFRGFRKMRKEVREVSSERK